METNNPEEEKKLDGIKELLDMEVPEPQNPVVVVRKPKKKKRGKGKRKEYEVQVIPATKGVVPPGETAPVKRVAAYCRVSTDEEARNILERTKAGCWQVYMLTKESVVRR